MEKKFKIRVILAMLIACIIGVCTTDLYAASASIKANKLTATVGDKVTVTVNINAATWNVKVAGSASDSIVGFNSDAENQSTVKTYNINTSKAGTYTVNISGDITDGVTDVNSAVSGSVTITVKEKPAPPPSSGSNSGTITTPKSSDATLKALKVGMEGLSPSFSKNTYIYTLSVGSEVNSIKVTASTSNSKAKYSVSGNNNLKNGDNTVLITVKAENGTTKTYKIIVTKAENPEKANAYLKNIIVDNVALKGEFAREIMEYTLEDVPSNVKKLSISAFPENIKATYTIAGADELKVGENVIKIKVTAEDKKTTKEYTLKVKQLEPKVEKNDNDKVEEQNNLSNSHSSTSNPALQKIKTEPETQLLILVYILAVVEFVEILYLFFQLRGKENEENPLESESKRRKSNREDN